jgi:hypothetical protein
VKSFNIVPMRVMPEQKPTSWGPGSESGATLSAADDKTCNRENPSAFDANVAVMRRRMAAERKQREERVRSRLHPSDPAQNRSQKEPYAEAAYVSVMANRGTDDWYAALCRRLAILEGINVSTLLADRETVKQLASRYADCFQPGIVAATERYLHGLGKQGCDHT